MRTSKQKSLEAILGKSARILRKNMDPGDYKHVILNVIFLKCLYEAFETLYLQRNVDIALHGAYPQDAEECLAKNTIFLPENAHWPYLQNNAGSLDIGKILDSAIQAVITHNRALQDVFLKRSDIPNLDPRCLGQLISLIGTLPMDNPHDKDLLGRAYDYFLGELAPGASNNCGQFNTPTSIVNLLIEMLHPYKGRVYDPCCGSGGMFVQCEKFVLANQGNVDDIGLYGQEINPFTYRLCRMNLALRRIDATNIKWNHDGSFLKDEHPQLKADFIFANPPFNDANWEGHLLADEALWPYGIPSKNNANFAWLQHIVRHLAPDGIAGCIMANGSLTSQFGNDGIIRQKFVNDSIVDCIVALPDRLFYNTGISVSLWILMRSKRRQRDNEILFIDASRMGRMRNRKIRNLAEGDIQSISQTYHEWRSKRSTYRNINGFCNSALREEVRSKDYNLTPSVYTHISFGGNNRFLQ